MTRFRQWWRRQYRSGYNGLDIATRFPGEDKLFIATLMRARVWGFGWPLVVVLASLVGWLMAGAVGGLVGGGTAVLLMALQIFRLAAKIRKRIDSPRTALAYGLLTMVAKWADLAGQVGYILDRRQGRMARLIEYKRVEDSRETAPLIANAEARP
jgi:hypothetical protein